VTHFWVLAGADAVDFMLGLGHPAVDEIRLNLPAHVGTLNKKTAVRKAAEAEVVKIIETGRASGELPLISCCG
jgi:hypothetical protein